MHNKHAQKKEGDYFNMVLLRRCGGILKEWSNLKCFINLCLCLCVLIYSLLTFYLYILFIFFRASRQSLPPAVGVLTQFHAWWHIFTGLGSYLHILLR